MTIELNGEPVELEPSGDGRGAGRARRGGRRPPRGRGRRRRRGRAAQRLGRDELARGPAGRGAWGRSRVADGTHRPRPRFASERAGGRRHLELGGREWSSRLIVGTGGFRSLEQMEAALEASGTEIVTVALRRVDPVGAGFAGRAARAARPVRLPNTAGCYTARDAVRTAQLAREAFETDWVKLEVIGDDRTLLPDAPELLAAAETLVADGLHRAARTPTTTRSSPAGSRRPGCAAVMPLGLADRLRGRDPQPLQPADHRRVRRGAGDLRRRDRHRVRRRAGDGARLRRRAAGELGLARRRSGADGDGDAPRGRGRATRRGARAASRAACTPRPRRPTRACPSSAYGRVRGDGRTGTGRVMAKLVLGPLLRYVGRDRGGRSGSRPTSRARSRCSATRADLLRRAATTSGS